VRGDGDRLTAHEAHEGGRQREGGGVDEERRAHARDRDQEAAECRPDKAQPNRLHELLQRVCVEQLLARNHARDDGREGGLEERLAHAINDHQHHEVPQLHRVAESERSDHADRAAAQEVGDHEQPPALEAVAQDPGRSGVSG
jgi:hypothetical protein